MCLSRVLKNDAKTHIGYKIFRKHPHSNGGFHIGNMFKNTQIRLEEMKKWIYADSATNITAKDGSIYNAGFHIIVDKEDALALLSGLLKIWQTDRTYYVYEVSYCNIITKGYERYDNILNTGRAGVNSKEFRCDIASWMMVGKRIASTAR